MSLLIKLLMYLATPLLLVAVVIFVVQTTLGTDDLKSCNEIPQSTGECQAADAIVAISGGDTDARTQEAVKLYKQGWAPKLIFSGAAEDKKGSSNAAVMKRTAVSSGVPESAISIEEYGSDTAGNAAGVAKIVSDQGLESIILVTSPYHQRRAYMEFSLALGTGVKVINHPTTTDQYWIPEIWWLNPYSWYLAGTELVKLMYVKVS
ncbi:MAG: YdcF family protein [Candidatus Woesebacteria bacterium]|jgi:uncharacterized SAM-binding protein YcdF (DUF218 family)